MYSIIIINLFSLVFNPHWTEHIYWSSPLQLRTLPDALYYVVGRHPSQLQDSKKINDQIFYLWEKVGAKRKTKKLV